MNTINERVAALVKDLGVTKVEFAKRLNVSSQFVSKVCSGTSGVSDRTIMDICDKYHVNEEWLRHGEGEMFQQRTREEEIEYFFGKVSDAPDDDFRRSFISVLAKLNEDQWELLADMATKLVDECKNKPGQE